MTDFFKVFFWCAFLTGLNLTVLEWKKKKVILVTSGNQDIAIFESNVVLWGCLLMLSGHCQSKLTQP